MKSVWYLNKNGISLNECGKYLTFSFIKLSNNKRGKWLLHFYFHLPLTSYIYTKNIILKK